MVASKPQSKKRQSSAADDKSAVLLSADWLEPRGRVSPKNVANCQHCGADSSQLRRISSWEWFVPQEKGWEGGYVFGCLSCLREGRIEWAREAKPVRPLWKDGG